MSDITDFYAEYDNNGISNGADLMTIQNSSDGYVPNLTSDTVNPSALQSGNIQTQISIVQGRILVNDGNFDRVLIGYAPGLF
jgi:phosphomannomutase